MPVSFNREILRSYPAIENYIEGQEACRRIFIASQNLNPPMSKWEVTRIVITSPFKTIFSLLLYITAFLAKLVGAKSLQVRCDLKSKHILRDIDKVINNYIHGKNLLTPTINAHDLQTEDFYLQAPLPVAEIRDERVRNMIALRHVEHVTFSHVEGVCRGISNWFSYLYFKTKEHIPDQETHLRAVAQEFERGAPREAALLHSLHYTYEPLLKLRVTPWVELENVELLNNIEHNVKRALQLLQQGSYAVDMPKHRINLIKVDDQHSYIFNPNEGLIRMDTLDQCAQYVASVYSPEKRGNFLAFSLIESNEQAALGGVQSSAASA